MGLATTSMNHSPPSSLHLHASANSSANSISPYDSISVGGASASASQPPSHPASQIGSQVLRRRSSYTPGTIPPDMLAPHWPVA